MGTKYRIRKRGRLWEVDALAPGADEWEECVMQSGFWQLCMFFVTADRRHQMPNWVLTRKLLWVSVQPGWVTR